MTNNILEMLISEGCSFIAYRTRKEITEDNIRGQEYLDYQKLIYEDKKSTKKFIMAER